MSTPAQAPVPARRRPADRPRGGQLLRFRDGRGNGGAPRRLPADTLVLMGVWLALVPTLMLFLSLVSAFVVRAGLADDWAPVPIPGLMWINTGVLLASSAALEAGRARQRRGGGALWLRGALVLGAAFLAGQVAVWRQLVAGGLELGTTPYGSFLYLLSGTHAVHVAAGMLGLLAAAFWPVAGWRDVAPTTVSRAAAVYWHFVDVIWVGLLLLLILWR